MLANKLQKEYLVAFRNAVYPDTQSRIDALIRMASVVIPYKKQTELNQRRLQFDNGKRILHKMWIKRNRLCWACGSKATARHHIIQLQNGGINSRKNIVSLCEECHAAVHPWLKVTVITVHQLK